VVAVAEITIRLAQMVDQVVEVALKMPLAAQVTPQL
jgi:hypothetical protein